MAKPNAKPNAIADELNTVLDTPVASHTLNILADSAAQQRAEELSARLNLAKQAADKQAADKQAADKQAADKQAADKLAQQTADAAARLKLAQQELVDAIKSLSVDKNVVLASVIRTYSVYGNGLEPVSMPSKLAGSTEGKVLTWVMENPDKLIALNKAVTTDNAAKTSDQIIAKVVSVIKAHITVKPYTACF